MKDGNKEMKKQHTNSVFEKINASNAHEKESSSAIEYSGKNKNRNKCETGKALQINEQSNKGIDTYKKHKFLEEKAKFKTPFLQHIFKFKLKFIDVVVSVHFHFDVFVFVRFQKFVNFLQTVFVNQIVVDRQNNVATFQTR
jgi:hypothetical protein